MLCRGGPVPARTTPGLPLSRSRSLPSPSLPFPLLRPAPPLRPSCCPGASAGAGMLLGVARHCLSHTALPVPHGTSRPRGRRARSLRHFPSKGDGVLAPSTMPAAHQREQQVDLDHRQDASPGELVSLGQVRPLGHVRPLEGVHRFGPVPPELTAAVPRGCSDARSRGRPQTCEDPCKEGARPAGRCHGGAVRRPPSAVPPWRAPPCRRVAPRRPVGTALRVAAAVDETGPAPCSGTDRRSAAAPRAGGPGRCARVATSGL